MLDTARELEEMWGWVCGDRERPEGRPHRSCWAPQGWGLGLAGRDNQQARAEAGCGC